MGLETIVGLVSRLLAKDAVFSAVQRALLSTLDARKSVERNVERLLATVNLPSARDIERVVLELEELDRQVARLQRRVAELSGAPAPKPPRTSDTPDDGGPR